MGLIQYLDASHFFIMSLLLITVGGILLGWKTQCRNNELKNSSTEESMRMAGSSILTAGCLPALISGYMWYQNVYRTVRISETTYNKTRRNGSGLYDMYEP